MGGHLELCLRYRAPFNLIQNMRLGASGSEGLEPYYYSVLFHPISPDLAPSDYHLSPGLKKTIQKSPFFVRRGGHYCRGDPVGRTTF